jgi:hypothetical protein
MVALCSLIVFAAFVAYVVDQSANAMMDMYRDLLNELLK